MILRLAIHAMATRFEIVLSGGDERSLRAVGESALEEIVSCHHRFSRFEPAGLPARVASAQGGRVRLDADSFDLLSLCARVWRDSGGAFDPTVGSLMARWGVGDEPTGGADAPRVGFGAVHLDADASTIAAPKGTLLDFGAVAKGFALDRAAAILREHGVRSAFLHGGTSSAIAIGAPEGEAGWRIRIRGSASDVAVTLRDAALGVSAPRGRAVKREGALAGHLMDPREGKPARGAETAAVICANAAEADAWSTALAVLAHRPEAAPAHATALIESRGAWTTHDPLGVIIESHEPRTEAA